MKHGRRGQAMVEMAILLPVLVLMAVVTVDLGRAFYYQEAIANAAREGARQGATDATPTTAEMTAAAEDEAGALFGGATGSLVVISNVEIATASVSGKYISVTAKYKFTALTPLAKTFIPGGGSDIWLTATSKMPAATTFTP